MKIERTVEELARWLDGQAEGDLAKRISGVAPLETAGPQDISFLESERAARQAAGSGAGCLLAPAGIALPERTVIRVRHPRHAFARIVELFFPPRRPNPGVHPTAQVAPGAALEDGVEIGPGVVIGEGVRIGAGSIIEAVTIIGEDCVLGEGCRLYSRVTLYPGVRLGARVVLHSGCVLGSDGFGYVPVSGRYHKFPQVGTLEVGDDVEVGANTTIDRGALGPTRIGSGTKIDNLVQIAHNVQIGEHCVIAAHTGISGSAVIEDHVVIAGQVGLGDHVRIEKGAVLGGQCGVLPHKTVRAGQTVWGTPARPVREHLEQQALVARLPRLMEQVRSLTPQETPQSRIKESKKES